MSAILQNYSIVDYPQNTSKDEFLAHFDQLNLAFSENALIGEKWRDFSASLDIERDGEEIEDIARFQDSEDFFNEDATLLANYNERFNLAVPNYLTGLGILGTFIGIAICFYNFDKTLAGAAKESAANVEQIIESLKPLLNGASFSFVTSIAGLLLSLVYSISEKIQYKKIKEALFNWNKFIDGVIDKITIEEIVNRQLTDFNKHADNSKKVGESLIKNQEAVVEYLNADLSRTLSSAVTDVLSKSLGSINGVLVEMRDRETLEIKTAIEIMLDSFMEKLQGSTIAGIQAVTDGLKNVGSEINSLTDNLNSANGQFTITVATMNAMIDNSRENIDSLIELTDKFKTVVAAFAPIANILETTANNVAESNREAAEALRVSVEKTQSEQEKNIGKLNENLSGFYKNFNESYQKIGESVKQSVENSQNLLEKSIIKFDGKLDAFYARFNETVNNASSSTKDVFASFVAKIGEYGAIAVNGFNSLDKSLKEYLSNFSGSLAKINEDLNSKISVTGEAQELILKKTLDKENAFLENFTNTQKTLMDDSRSWRDTFIADCKDTHITITNEAKENVKTIMDQYVKSQEEMLGKSDKTTRTLIDNSIEHQRSLINNSIIEHGNILGNTSRIVEEYLKKQESLGENNKKAMKDFTFAVEGIISGSTSSADAHYLSVQNSLTQMDDAYTRHEHLFREYLLKIASLNENLEILISRARGEAEPAVMREIKNSLEKLNLTVEK
ncbi:MAG: hypothetical protein LBO66_09060 [Deltaproteobacteria bacterium]|nr:hypothetical protein [Deltaproteobacteria bacterium]